MSRFFFLSKFIKHDSSDDFSNKNVVKIFVMLISERAEILLIKYLLISLLSSKTKNYDSIMMHLGIRPAGPLSEIGRAPDS